MGALERDGEEEKDNVEKVAVELDIFVPWKISTPAKKLDFVKCLQSRKSPSFLRFRDIHGQQYLMSSEGNARLFSS